MKEKIVNLFRKYGIKNISCDSRNLSSSDAFFAIKGENFDGNDFIEEAIQNDALVFTDNLENAKNKVIYVENIRLALGLACDIIYTMLPKNLIAATGTNGKSSVVSYVCQIFKLLGMESASIGTIGIESTIPIEQDFINSLPKLLTTPDAITFRKILNELAKIGVDNVAFEASSHGIAQKRLGFLKVKTAAFTSFSQDHLDYHKTMENYLATKLQFFVDNLDENAELVINSEIFETAYGNIVKNFLEEKKIRYCTVGKNGDIKINKIKSSLASSDIDFEHDKKHYKFTTNIVGSFQATNLLIALKMVTNIINDFDKIVNILDKVVAVAGRLERIGDVSDEFQVFVDYAHTPDALEKSLSELKKIKFPDGKLYVLFGCGGDRDYSKRAIMGQIASKLADYVIITDDNPRNEDPAKIRLDILKGATKAELIDNGREFAIKNTIEKLKKNDILLIAGKGHEDYQIIGDKILFFSDIEIAKKMVNLKKINI